MGSGVDASGGAAVRGESGRGRAAGAAGTRGRPGRALTRKSERSPLPPPFLARSQAPPPPPPPRPIAVRAPPPDQSQPPPLEPLRQSPALCDQPTGGRVTAPGPCGGGRARGAHRPPGRTRRQPMGRRQLGACALIGRRGRAKGEHVAGGGHVVGPGGGPGGLTGPGAGRGAAVPRQSRLPPPGPVAARRPVWNSARARFCLRLWERFAPGLPLPRCCLCHPLPLPPASLPRPSGGTKHPWTANILGAIGSVCCC